jgi:GNAT superfamily N-acetyltransferase
VNSDDDITIGVAGPERLGDLRALYLSLLESDRAISPVAMLEPGEHAWAARRATYAEAFAEDRAVLLLAEAGPEPVGYALVLVHRASDDTYGFAPAFAELYSLVVAPQRRGAGLGHRLMDAVDALVAERGLTALSVAVTLGNEDALRFYERRGLVPAELVLYRRS